MNWTKYNMEALEASKTLRPITKEQRLYGEKHCEKIAVAYRNKFYCSECGSYVCKKGEFQPNMRCSCGAKLHQVLKKGSYGFYYDVITTHRGFQVVRHYLIYKYVKASEKAKYTTHEVVQNWIDDKGNESIIARKVRPLSCRYDDWDLASEMILKRKNTRYDIYGFIQFPKQKFTDKLKQYGAKKAIGYPNKFCVELIKNRDFENVLKMRQEKVIEETVTYGRYGLTKYLNQIRICTKHGYKIEDYGMWLDYIRDLEELGYDTLSPKYLCPTDLREAHEVTHAKIRKKWEKQRKEEERKRAMEAEKDYSKRIAKFIGLCIVGNGIEIKPLESVFDFFEEGEAMHHCVYTNGYYKNKNSLILSAKDTNGKRIETIEVDLKKFSVVQSRGVCNKNTERHEEILELMNENMKLIKKYNKKTA